MATSKIQVSEGTGKNLATNSFTEDAVTKEVSRVVLNDSSGNELTANIGALTETAPASDTASSGLNGRLQRIAQRITSLIALLPSSIGQKAGSGSLSVVLPSDQVTSTPMIARATFTCTLASLATASARQSTLISNSSNYPAAKITLKITSGGIGPTAGSVYEVYLIRSDGTNADDAAGASDAAITIENAVLLGTIVTTNTANKAFYGVFDTAPFGPLGTSWGIAIKNSSGQSLDSTEGNHAKAYEYYYPKLG